MLLARQSVPVTDDGENEEPVVGSEVERFTRTGVVQHDTVEVDGVARTAVGRPLRHVRRSHRANLGAHQLHAQLVVELVVQLVDEAGHQVEAGLREPSSEAT